MSSKNISIKKEAYDFLSSIKTKDESFSDVILRFKARTSNKAEILRLLDKPRSYKSSIDVKKGRNEFERRAKRARDQVR